LTIVTTSSRSIILDWHQIFSQSYLFHKTPHTLKQDELHASRSDKMNTYNSIIMHKCISMFISL